MIILKKEEEKGVEVVEKVDYKKILVELYNPLIKEYLNNPLKEHCERIKKLAKPITNIDNNIKSIIEILQVLCAIENDMSAEEFSNMKSYSSISNNTFYIKIKNDTIFSSHKYAIRIQCSILPYCCGISEYGNFMFNGKYALDSNLENTKYNLIIDLIRLHSMFHRKNVSGAYSIINYFVDTPFMKYLELRDDLTFIKKFTNPKTGATLKTFIFDSKIA